MNNKILKNMLILGMFLVPCSLFAQEADKARNFLKFSMDNPFFPVLLLVGIAVAGFTFFKPRFGLIVMLLFILISTDMQVSESSGGYGSRGISIRIEDLILVLVSGGWLLNRAKTRSLLEFRRVPINKPIILMSFVILIAYLVGFLQGTTPFARGVLFTMKRLEYFWIFFMVLNIMKGDNDVRFAIKILIWVTIFVSSVGFVQFFLFPLSGLTMGGATATSGFGRANTLADVYLIVGGVFLGLLIYSVERGKTYVYMAVMILCAAAIVMTKSRGAYVSVPPLVCTILLVTKNKKILLSIIIVVVLFAFYIVGMLVLSAGKGTVARGAEKLTQKHTGDIGNQFESLSDIAQKGSKADSSFNARVTAWEDAFPKIGKYPLIGHGVGAAPLSAFDCQYVHELYETGIIGLFMLLYLNLVVFVTTFNFFQISNDPFTKGICSGFIGGQVAMLVHGVSIVNFYTIMNMEIFWVIVAMIMVLYHNHFKREQENEMNEKSLNMKQPELL